MGFVAMRAKSLATTFLNMVLNVKGFLQTKIPIKPPPLQLIVMNKIKEKSNNLLSTKTTYFSKKLTKIWKIFLSKHKKNSITTLKLQKIITRILRMLTLTNASKLTHSKLNKKIRMLIISKDQD